MRRQPASDRFHLLSVCSSRAYGGLERFQLEIARSMAERGHTVTVVSHPGSRFGEAALEADFPVLPLRFGSYLAPLTTLRLSRIMRRTGVHVVHYRLSRDIWTVAPAARLAGLRGKVVHTLGMNPGGRLDNPVHRWLRDTLGAFVCPTPTTARSAERVWGMSEGEAVLIPNFTDESRFLGEGLESEAAKLRGSWTGRNDQLAIGMLGRLEPGKGVETFTRAAEELHREIPGMRFIVAGPASPGKGPWLESLRARARERIGDAILFAGPLPPDEVPAFMRALDVFVLPSDRETFGTVLVEAMTAGAAVVSTHGPGPDFILEKGAHGLQFPPRDVDALCHHIRELARDDGLRAELREKARTRALASFTRSVVAPRYEALFMEVAGAAGPAGQAGSI